MTHLSETLLRPLSLAKNHVDGCGEDDATVSNITKHHREEEGESDHGEKTRVDFLICRDTIAVHDRLEAFGELVRAVERRWCLVRPKLVQDGRNVGTRFFLLKRETLNGIFKVWDNIETHRSMAQR